MPPSDSDIVRDQYEAYPYPARDPADEATRLVTGSPSHLLEVNHCVFAGRRDFAKPFRALVAGGGTGDAAIMLAQQLADAGDGGLVDYIDLSDASKGIAESRARARGLTNIAFHRLSLLDLPQSGLGPYDYIDCCGVLHHLADPAAGLAALQAVVAEDGGIGLMVYGTLGRIGVYHLQEALRHLAPDDPLAEKVRLTRRLLGELPAVNWLKRNPFVADHLAGDDAGLVDLLLHGRDRAYRVSEIADLVDGAGLRLVAFGEPARYDPDSYVTDPALRKRLARLDPLQRATVAELLAGNMKKHVFYAVPAGRPEPVVAVPDGPEAIPHLWQMDGAALANQVKPGAAMTANVDGIALRLPLPRLGPAILRAIDGRRDLGAIHGMLTEKDSALDWGTFKAQFDRLYAALNGLGKLFIAFPPA